jgi:hypothetical protein
MEKIKFLAEDGESMEWYVLEQTTVGGINYILVTDAEEGDAEALILKDLSAPGDEEADYVIVEDEEELNSVAGIFENLVEDVKLT